MEVAVAVMTEIYKRRRAEERIRRKNVGETGVQLGYVGGCTVVFAILILSIYVITATATSIAAALGVLGLSVIKYEWEMKDRCMWCHDNGVNGGGSP
ncbi:hypothetical protein QJS10_CPA05g01720 [Acorus calamus]|uniref:Uncharacterized protein n=1 Tax=Acorus calamus TaxID=4465 RepID=A0AAV9ESV9_ACOCL|nr:hypothetical protein QJS10_CPA05g01720 [Acorus calamus]